MRQSDRVRSLAVFAEERLDAFPDIPTAEEITGDPWAAGTWRGVVGPAGLPGDVRETLVEASQAVYESEEFQSFMADQGFGTQWKGPEDFRDFMAEADDNNAEIIDKLGLAE